MHLAQALLRAVFIVVSTLRRAVLTIYDVNTISPFWLVSFLSFFLQSWLTFFGWFIHFLLQILWFPVFLSDAYFLCFCVVVLAVLNINIVDII